ncbi:protein shortage in chiasmata 1 ortholog [Elgaria multicarinata webbii]|uniref:protein shortage in chiasmata 1 ortholog n=1 Tax=Elgaria multicarinata webbii TaxID=159646 RepID=UPI002FCD374E
MRSVRTRLLEHRSKIKHQITEAPLVQHFMEMGHGCNDFKFLRVTRQRFSFESLSIHIPSCLYQDKNYYHDGGFADDKYRRPWTRVSADSTQITLNISVLDYWKKCLYIEDFLEKKPISSTLFHIHNEDVEVVPSSNPCSQLDIEDAYMLMKDANKADISYASQLQSNYVPVVLKQQEGLYIEDELIFTDNLIQYAKWLPTLRTLLSRLNIFHMQDPLLNSEGDNITEEDIFRECLTFKRSVMPQSKQKELHEDFCKFSLKDEETLVLPIQLHFYKTTNFRLDTEIPTYLALKSLLQVTPEVIGDENECFKIISQDFRVKITPEKIESSKYCYTQEVGNRNALEFSNLASHASFYPGELDVPLTPPSKSEKLHVNSQHAQLQSEPISPISKSDFITESTAEYLEGLMWQSEKYQNLMNSLLLTENQTFVPLCQQLPVTELKTLLSIHEDISVFNSLEEDGWINLWGEMPLPCVLETLSTDLSDRESLVCANVEAFSKMTDSQLDKWLEQKSSFLDSKLESFSVPDDSETKDSCWSLQKKDIFPAQSLGPTSVQYIGSLTGDNTPIGSHMREIKLQSETGKVMHFGNQEDEKHDPIQPVSCKEVSFESNSAPGNKKPSPFELPKKSRDDFDLLSNFIMLRSKRMIIQNEEANNVDIQKEGRLSEESPAFENHTSPVVLNAAVPMEKPTKENETIASIEIKASESQIQAYHVLEAAVAPVLKELMTLGMNNWRFATLNFDETRFFLKQQEKVISDTLKQGVTDTKDAKDTTLFKHAAILHLLVTVRDLLLTCSLNTALGYLSKAKDRYKDFLGSSLDNIWRQLEIVQFVIQKHETIPKITELQHQMFKWMQSNVNDQNKAVIVTRMDFDEETAALINTVSAVQGLKIVYLECEKRGTFLESKNVINSLEIYSCVVVRNQHIGPDFPWTRFSLVVEYNYSENSCWIDHCKNLSVSYMTFRTALPETAGIEEVSPDNFGWVLQKLQIPYVFLTSEGLLNTPEILQLLESKYNISFIERSCCDALQFFGSTERYVVMAIDECTAIVMQNVEELNYEKSSDNIVLRLMVLSLQYSACWIILYSRERLNSKYSLAGKTLHHLALIYAALVPFAQKSEDFEVKVALTPGVEETALLVRQIADHILMNSKRHPQEWLDKSWLSVLPLEAEKYLLTFPCMNPLVAQVMLKKSSSLEWLLSATFDQLQELLPEVPEKVLKLFSDITSLYTLNPPTESQLLKETVPLEENMNPAISPCSQVPSSKVLLSSFQGHSPLTEYSGCFHEVQKSKSHSPPYCQNESCTPMKSAARHNFMALSVSGKGDVCSFQDNIGGERQQYLPFLKTMETERRVGSSRLSPNNLGRLTHINFQATMPYLGYNQGNTNTNLVNGPQNRMRLPKEAEVPVLLKNCTDQDVENVYGMKTQPLVKQHNSTQDFQHSWYPDSDREDVPFQQSSDSFLGEFGGTARSSPECRFEERFWDGHPFMQAMYSSPHDPSFYKTTSNLDRFFNLDVQTTAEYTGKKKTNVLTCNQRERDVSAGLEFTQLPQIKKRRLTFEKDPGRSDGQTRLKFF